MVWRDSIGRYGGGEALANVQSVLNDTLGALFTAEGDFLAGLGEAAGTAVRCQRGCVSFRAGGKRGSGTERDHGGGGGLGCINQLR